MTQSTIRSAYAQVSDLYISLFGSQAQVHPDDLVFVRRHLADENRGPVLDAGCGPGHLTAYLHALGVAVHGVDLVAGFVEHARRSHPQCDFAVGSYTALEMEAAALGGVLAWFSLIHLPPEGIAPVLRSFRQALAVDGMLVLGLFDGPDLQPFPHKVATAYTWSPGGAQARLEGADFEVVDLARRPEQDGTRAVFAVAARAV